MNDEQVYLNVGGTIFMTYKDTLLKSEYFNKENIIDLLSNTSKKTPFFLDKDPKIFRHVLNYLRNNEYEYPKKYFSELVFFGIKNNNVIIKQKCDIIEKVTSYNTLINKEDVINKSVNYNAETIIVPSGRNCNTDILLSYIFNSVLKNYYLSNGGITKKGFFVNKVDINRFEIVSHINFGNRTTCDVFYDFFCNKYQNFELTIVMQTMGSHTGGNFCHRSCKIINNMNENNLENIKDLIDDTKNFNDITERFNVSSDKKALSNYRKVFEILEIILKNNITKMIIYYDDYYLFCVYNSVTNSLILFSNDINVGLLYNFDAFLNLCLLHTTIGSRILKGYVKEFSKVILVAEHTVLIVF